MTGEDVMFRAFAAPSCIKPAPEGTLSHIDLCIGAKVVLTPQNALHCGMAFTDIRFVGGCKYSCQWRFNL